MKRAPSSRTYQTKSGVAARTLNARLGLPKYSRNSVPTRDPAERWNEMEEQEQRREGPPGHFYPQWLKERGWD